MLCTYPTIYETFCKDIYTAKKGKRQNKQTIIMTLFNYGMKYLISVSYCICIHTRHKLNICIHKETGNYKERWAERGRVRERESEGEIKKKIRHGREEQGEVGRGKDKGRAETKR